MLYKQLAVSELEQVGVPMGTGLDDILETIRIHWERDVEKNRMEAETSLQSKVRGRPRALLSALYRRRPRTDAERPAYKGRNAVFRSHEPKMKCALQ